MIALEHLLVATDFSEAADAALSCGRSLARTFGATLHVIHVSENVFLGPIVLDSRSVEEAALNHLLRRLIAEDRRPLRTRCRRNLACSSRSHRRLRSEGEHRSHFMGTHGRTGAARLFVEASPSGGPGGAVPRADGQASGAGVMLSSRRGSGDRAIVTEPVHLLETEVAMVTLRTSWSHRLLAKPPTPR